MLGRLLHNRAFQKAWLSASALVGALAVLAGIFELTHSHPGGIAGILGGLAMLLIGSLGFWMVRRPTPPRPSH